jgi:hypothetical protein
MRFVTPCALTLLLAAAACGGGKSSPTSPTTTATTTAANPSPTPTPTPTPSPAPSGSMTFKVDGGAVTATSTTATFANGILSVSGGTTASSTILAFSLTPSAAGTGTYPLGLLSPSNALIQIGNPAAGWQAGVGIGSGTISLTALTSTGATGTFSFTLAAVPGTGATGTKTVTEGAFTVTFTTTPTPTPTPSTGSTISALIDGVAWSGSLSRRATLTNGILAVTGQDTSGRVITLTAPISASLAVPPSAPPTISMNFGAIPQGVAQMVLGAQNWDNGRTGGAGTFTVTSISSTRVTGTFTVTLISNPANAVALPPAQITNGQFDMALERF